jgi:hypothetical protein
MKKFKIIRRHDLDNHHYEDVIEGESAEALLKHSHVIAIIEEIKEEKTVTKKAKK